MSHELKATASFYDSVAARYDAEVDGLNANTQLREAFRRRVSAMAGTGRSILDFGCGTGADAAWYASQGHRVIAYDISSGMVDLLRARCAVGIANEVVVPLSGELVTLVTQLEREEPVAAVAANFAVLNHISDLRPLLAILSAHVAHKGGLLASVLNPFYRHDIASHWWWRGLPGSLWTGAIKMEGEVATYRHYTRSVRRMAAPHFEQVFSEGSAAAVVDGPSRSTSWRATLASNFLFLALRKVG